MEADQQKKKKSSRWLFNLGIVFCILIIGFCLWQLIPMWSEYAEGESEYEGLGDEYLTTAAPEATTWPKPSLSLAPGATPPAFADMIQPSITVDFVKLAEINEDVVAWIRSEGTVINYPIVQGTDNEHYLHFLFTKKRNNSGSIFVDYRNDPGFLDRNTIIYGHRMNNGSMFASLLEYKNQEYFDEHPYLELYTPNGFYILEIFSAYTTPAKGDYVTLDFADSEVYGEFLEEMMEASEIETGVVVTAQDQIVTLSTCEPDASAKRFAVQCKLTPLWIWGGGEN